MISDFESPQSDGGDMVPDSGSSQSDGGDTIFSLMRDMVFHCGSPRLIGERWFPTENSDGRDTPSSLHPCVPSGWESSGV